MHDQAAIENAHHPLLRWTGLTVGIVMLAAFISSLLPLPDALHHGIALSLYVIAGLACVAAYGYMLAETVNRTRALKSGRRIQAVVIHRQHKIWGGGTGGQTWKLTLRYRVDDRLFEVTRSVNESEYKRSPLNAIIEIAVRSSAPKAWFPVPPVVKQTATVRSDGAANRIGAAAFALLTTAAIVTIHISRIGIQDGDAIAPWIYCFFLGAVGLAVSVYWWLGRGRIGGPVFLCYMAFFFIVPLFVATATPWIRVLMIVAWLFPAAVVVADARTLMKTSRRCADLERNAVEKSTVIEAK